MVRLLKKDTFQLLQFKSLMADITALMNLSISSKRRHTQEK